MLRVISAILAAVVLLAPVGADAAPTYPVVSVQKKVEPLGPDKSAIDMLESATVTIRLEGDTVYYPTGVDTAVVLILDESGSMDGKEGYSRGAAKAVLGIVGASDRVGLVAFNAGLVANIAPTTNHAQILAAINALDDPDGLTNALLAFNTANQMLLADKAAVKRIAIFFTDGEPTPLTQMDQIGYQTPFLNKNNITYFTVPLGTFLKKWLEDLATNTGGVFCSAADGPAIQTCFLDAFKKGSQYVSAQQVAINEVLSKNFKPVAGTLTYSMGGAGVAEPTDFKAAMGKAEQAFYASGTLTTPPIFELPKGRTFDVSFDVTPATCKDKKQDLPVDDTAKTYLTYKYGQKVFDIYHPTYNQAWIPVSPCGVYVEKSFDQTNRVISISVRNTFQDRVVSDVHVIEVVGPDVGHLIGEATPFSYQGERQVVWPHYPKGESWRTDGVEWRLFSGHFVGGTQFTPYPPIGWQVTTHSYIPEGKQVEFRLPIYAKPSAAGKTNVLLNKGNVVDIESGGSMGSYLSFSYPIPFGVDKIKSEQVGGYAFHYTYESVSGTDWSARRHVIVQLPDLYVPVLKPEWPYSP